MVGVAGRKTPRTRKGIRLRGTANGPTAARNGKNGRLRRWYGGDVAPRREMG